jgi:hypothetical protein
VKKVSLRERERERQREREKVLKNGEPALIKHRTLTEGEVLVHMTSPIR